MNLKCLTALVTKTSSRGMPISASASSRTRPAGPTKGRALAIFLVPGLFADQHERGARVAGTGDDLGGVLVEVAALASRHGGLQDGDRVVGGHEGGGGGLF